MFEFVNIFLQKCTVALLALGLALGEVTQTEPKQGTLAEGEGTVQLTSF